jgi:hypothetical protein
MFRKRQKKALCALIALIHHPGAVFFRNSEVSMPSQSAQGNTPRQLCCIGFSFSAAWAVKPAFPVVTPEKRKQRTASSQNKCFFTMNSL